MAASDDDRGDIIYALRTAHQSQVQLNVMADQKANILVGTILVLLTFLFTRLSTFEVDAQWLQIMIMIVSTLEVIAALLGIMVIRPRTRYLRKQVKINDMPNPLFFGFFCQFEEPEYIHYMRNLLVDNQAAHQLLLKDYYQIGQVLKRKFLLLNFAYLFATSGLLIALAALAMYTLR